MRRRLASLGTAGLLLALAGCVSLKRTPEARYFALRSLLAPSAEAQVAADGPLVGLLAVRVPGHLDRPQLVSWTAPQELRIDELLRWAEPLDEGATRTLAENLGALLPRHRVVRSPWPASTALRARVAVELRAFGPQADGTVRLEGVFAILEARAERPLVRQAFALERPTPGGATGGREPVEAMSELVADLARRVAAAVDGLPPAGAAGP